MIHAPAGLFLAIALATSSVPATTPYSASAHGQLAGWRLSGVEPDGDPLYQAVLKTTLAPWGNIPRLNMIVDAYMEQFKPDTVPILPDLLNGTKKATNLGGFLQGKVLLTDDAGNIISIGSFVAEAFLDNSNSAAMTLYASKNGYGAIGGLKGRFTLRKVGNTAVAIDGHFAGRLGLSAAARTQVLAHRGNTMRSVESIIGGVNVTPHAMVGRTTTRSQSVPLRTGFGNTGSESPVFNRATTRAISPLTIAAGAGAMLSFLLAALLYWRGRKTERQAQP